MLASQTLSSDTAALADSTTLALSYRKEMQHYAEYLISQVSESGFMKASKTFDWYSMHWFRDSSFVAMALLRSSRIIADDNKELAERMIGAAHRINSFNMGVVERRIGSIHNALNIDLSNHEEFFRLSNHVPARIDADGNLHRYDSAQETAAHSWLLQHDSVPLLVCSLYDEMNVKGYRDSSAFLDKNREVLLAYLVKIIKTECSDAWEERGTMLHAYDVGAIYAAIKKISDPLNMQPEAMLRGKGWRIDESMLDGGRAAFLKQMFVHGGVIYSQRQPFSDSPDTNFGVDGSELYLFSQFGIGKALGDPKIEEETVRKIEEDLFAGNVLPVRYKHDPYRGGGRWLLLGLRYADYVISKGQTGKGARIIDYVASKFAYELPEQDMVNVETPEEVKADGSIEWLAWSYGEMLNAMSSFIESQRMGAAAGI